MVVRQLYQQVRTYASTHAGRNTNTQHTLSYYAIASLTIVVHDSDESGVWQYGHGYIVGHKVDVNLVSFIILENVIVDNVKGEAVLVSCRLSR